MILISHRGNTSGKNKDRENTTQYIQEAVDKGFDVEVDIWFENEKFFLGHDGPEEEIEQSWFHNKPLWCHCKNYSALKELLNLGVHCFFHNQDDYTLTSKGFVWAYPGKIGNANTITVMPAEGFDTSGFAGICSDDIEKYKKKND